MSSCFITILNMSLTASYVALAVIIVRWLLKKAPKVFAYALWAVVFFRLLCPFTFESSLSLIPGRTDAIPQNIVHTQEPAISSGITIVDHTVNQSVQSSLPPVSPAASVNPMGLAIEIGSLIWVAGIMLLLFYSLFSYLRLKRRLSVATLVGDNIWETDRIQTAFVLGLFKPRIYIPTGLTGDELDYIVKHEQTHIKRYDYLIKPLAFLALALHWFNPLVWVSYFLMIKDMEMSCDESIMKQSSEDIRARYSSLLLALSVKQNALLSPLAFGESNVKSRIKNVLNYSKPAFGTVVLLAAAAVAVSVGLMANPVNAVTYKNEALGFSLKIPKDWDNKYTIEETENSIDIFNREIHEKYNGAGRLLTIERQIGELITAEDMLQAPVGQQIILQGNGFTYFSRMPSDVQYPVDDERLGNEYQTMNDQISDVCRSISLLGKREPVAANAGFKVKGTSFFTVEVPVGWEMKALEGFPPCWGIFAGDRQVGIIELIPFHSQESYSDKTYQKYLGNEQTFRKVRITLDPENTDLETRGKMVNSFKFTDGPYNVVDLQTTAETYIAQGGAKVFGQITGFKMEDGNPVAVHVKTMKFIPDGLGDNSPNGFRIEDLNQTKTYALAGGVHIAPLTAPHHNTCGIYEMPLLDRVFLKNYPEHKDFYYDFIIGGDGQLKIVLGHYVP